jgi:hypothetical protein
VVVESEEGIGSAFGFRIPFELASLDIEVKPVETTHTNVSHLNPLPFAHTPLGDALSFTTVAQYSRLCCEIDCQYSMSRLLLTSAFRSCITSSKLTYFKTFSQSRLPFVRTRLDAISVCDSQDTSQEGSYTAPEGEKSDDCTMLLSPSLFAPSAFSRSNRSSLSMSTLASNPPSFASSRDASDNEADTSVAKSENHLLKTCLIVDGKPNSLSLDYLPQPVLSIYHSTDMLCCEDPVSIHFAIHPTLLHALIGNFFYVAKYKSHQILF